MRSIAQYPSVETLKLAEIVWVKDAQQSISHKVESGHYERLCPVKDEDGIYKVYGRTEKWLKDMYNCEGLILLPSTHRISHLYALWVHNRDHLAVTATICKIRNTFWISHVQRIVANIRNKCVICKKLYKQRQEQIMGSLPECRVKPVPPFHVTFLDLFGPFPIRGVVNKRSRSKCFGVIFTCGVSRAVHCDLVQDYSTDSFLQALKRFATLRGYPSEIYSDSGSQLTKANKEIGHQKVNKEIGHQKVNKEIGHQKVNKEIGHQKVNKEIGHQKVNKEIGHQKVNKEIGHQKVNKEIGHQKVNKEIGHQKVNKEIGHQKVNKEIGHQKVNKEIGHQKVNKEIGHQKVNKEIAHQKVNKEIGHQKVNKEIGHQKVNKEIGHQKVNKEIGHQKVNKEIGHQKVNKEIGHQKVNKERHQKVNKEIGHQKVIQLQKGLTWHFSTPSAPWKNGCAEALIKSIKKSITVVIGDQVLSFPELQTVVFEAANIVHERPIAVNARGLDDGSYLCPNDLILGRASSSVPSGPFKGCTNPRKRFEFVQSLVDCFWKKWIRDFFPSLIIRSNWHMKNRNAHVGDIIIMQELNALRGHWKLGKVSKVYTSEDGVIRNVDVQYKNESSKKLATVKRAIQSLVVILPVEECDT